MRTTTLLRTAALLAVPLLAMTACGGDSAGGGGDGGGGDTSPIKLGLIYSSEGPFANNSATARAGAQYAVELINADGGVEGRDLELVEVDARNDPQSLTTTVPQMVSRDGVFAILAPPDSAGCEIACAVAAELETPVMSPGAGRPGVLEPSRPWSFTLAAPDIAVSTPVLESVIEEQGFEKVAIIFDEANATTKAQVELFNGVFEATGVEVVSETTYTSGDPSFTSQVTSMAAAQPDAIALAAGPADAARIAVEVRAQGLDAVLMGTSSLQSGGTEYISAAGPAADGTLSAAQFDPTNPDEPAASLLAQAREDNDLEVVPLNFAYAFDLVHMVAEYITESGATLSEDTLADDRQGLLEYLEGAAYEGMSGTAEFNDDGTGARPELKAVVEDGQFVITPLDG